MVTNVRVQILVCPSCKKTFPINNFSHSCESGPWYSACYCNVCKRPIDGNEPHLRGMDPDHAGPWSQ